MHAVRPSLNLAFRFQTGYRIEVPMKQYTGAGHSWSVVIRVTPEVAERDPVWLVSRIRIPAVPDKNAVAELGGAYIVGEGKYHVDIMLIDDNQRRCSDNWTIRANLDKQVREVRPGMPAGMVDDLSLRRSRARRPAAAEAKYRVSILLHASAAMPHRVRLRDYDRMLLMSALGSLAERLPAGVRLSVFSMDAQKEIYSTEDLSPDSFGEAFEALNELELGKVDYKTLQHPRGHLDLVSSLLNKEFDRPAPPDAIVILGPLARWGDRVPDEALPSSAGTVPIYYVQLRPWRQMRGIGPDTIAQAVRKLGGKTKQVYSPADFAEAIRDLEHILAERGRSAALN